MQRADEELAWIALSRAPALDIPILSAAFEFLGGHLVTPFFESAFGEFHDVAFMNESHAR